MGLYCEATGQGWEGSEIECFSPQAACCRWSSVAARLALLPILASLLALPAIPAGAEDSAPEVSLDDLLKLPSGVEYDSAKKGGATRDQWRSRFQAARMELRQAKAALATSLEELDEMGDGGSWQMAPPGLGQIMQNQSKNQQTGANAATGQPGDVPPSLGQGLSGQIRRQKDEVKRAERALRDLEVEANLAAVPEDWRK